MTIGEVLRRSTDHLAARGAGRPRLEAERLLAHALGLERVELYMHLDRPLSVAELDDAPRVLDVGAGSGAVALALADEHPGARVTAIDVSEDALSLARENAERTGIVVELLHHDLFAGLPGDGWDLVVSNPPYVRDDELASLESEVLDWEPALALFDRGHTEALVRAAAQALRPGGALAIETHEDNASGVAGLLDREGYVAVRTTKDLAGRDRVVEGRTPT